MLELHNVRMKPSNVRKNKGTTKCDKKTITYDVGTAQCKNGTIKCEDLVTRHLLMGIVPAQKKRGYGRITRD